MQPDIKVVTQNTKDSSGIKLLSHNELITKCDTFIGLTEAERVIETNKKYQRQGFAGIALCKVIPMLLERNLLPAWSCWDFHTASVRLAEKYCFKETTRINIYLWYVYI